MNARTGKKLVNVFTLFSFLCWNLAVAAPEGGSVAAGSASISQSGTLTTVNQSSQNTVINWNSFDTAANETVQFNQPNSSAIALNRINNGLPTQFAGALKANGNVWVLNPAGVLFTASSTVDVAGLLATTHDISNANFMAGNYVFDAVPGYENSKVINNGLISAKDTGMVALVAPGVENNGVIVANMGKVHLASGTAFVLDLYGDQLINFGNSAPANSGYVKNAGKIVANGGKVYMTANSAAQAVDNVINMSGVIEARSVSSSHGTIILNGGHKGKVRIAGKLDASNVVANETGGFIETSGEDLEFTPDANISVGYDGTWLLDPYNIYIDYCLANMIMSSLNSGSNVYEYAWHNIYVNAPITSTYEGYVKLSLKAHHKIEINAPITLGGYGSLKLESKEIKIYAPISVGGYFKAEAWEKIYLNTDSITSGWSQTYDGKVYLGSNIVLTSMDGDITFEKTVKNAWWSDPNDLTINVLNGRVKFKDDVGSYYSPLNNLVINGMTKFWAWCEEIDVYTVLSQIYNGAVTSNTDVAMITFENGAILLDQGYSAPWSALYLVPGDDGYTDAFVHGNNIDVGFLLFAGYGKVDLYNTTVDGYSGPDAFNQVYIEGYGDHYCVNGVGLGSCMTFLPLTEAVQTTFFMQPLNPGTFNAWSITVTDAEGNAIGQCDEKGCVLNIAKNF